MKISWVLDVLMWIRIEDWSEWRKFIHIWSVVKNDDNSSNSLCIIMYQFFKSTIKKSNYGFTEISSVWGLTYSPLSYWVTFSKCISFTIRMQSSEILPCSQTIFSGFIELTPPCCILFNNEIDNNDNFSSKCLYDWNDVWRRFKPYWIISKGIRWSSFRF